MKYSHTIYQSLFREQTYKLLRNILGSQNCQKVEFFCTSLRKTVSAIVLLFPFTICRDLLSAKIVTISSEFLDIFEKEN